MKRKFSKVGGNRKSKEEGGKGLYADTANDIGDAKDVDTGGGGYDVDNGEAYEDGKKAEYDVDNGEASKGDPKYQDQNVTHGFHMLRGKMGHGMEDFIVAENRKIYGHSLGLYAIFDGHSGRDVAEYLQSHLIGNILSQSDFWTHPKSAVSREYRATDADILENVVGSRGGSTAVTAVLIDGKKLVGANVGDSRAILCRNGKAKGITIDHEPLKEKKQVEKRGGWVIKLPGNIPRVDGQLAMTRAFGDKKLKEHITAKPDVIFKKIDKEVDFLILASDGLWKILGFQASGNDGRRREGKDRQI
ncbi:putative protein phosphatase 2C 58 isoform X1 [Apium graveolens]|uniref:putative protein phosphatase 2C 58 isoform X1 n=1 Tax=Apium graveolens TaxID=4045 RepID=UPI003D79A355